MRDDPIVEEIHRIRQAMLDEFGGDVDALMDDVNRRVLGGEFGSFRLATRSPKPARAASRRGRDG